MLYAETITIDVMSGQTTRNAAKILTTCMSGVKRCVKQCVKKCVNYAAENPFCYQYENNTH